MSTHYICFRSKNRIIYLVPVVQSMVSLTSLLLVKMLTVLLSTISNSQVFLLKNILAYAIFNDQSFNNMLTNDIVSFEQLGPGYPS